MSLLAECYSANGAFAFVVFWLTFLLIQFSAYFYRMRDRFAGRVPPGPPAFPMIGTVSVDRLHPEVTFQKWAVQYGKVFSFFLGDRFCIGVADMNLVKRFFKDERFSGRSKAGIIQHLNGAPHKGIIIGDGDLWKEHRRFSLTALRDFGFGKALGADLILKEASNLLSSFKEHAGEPFDPKLQFARTAANVVSGLLFSSDFHPSDTRFVNFINNVNENLHEFVHSGLMEVYPWLRWVYPFSTKLKLINSRMLVGTQLMMSLVQEHRRSFDPQHPRDYIDAFFCMQQNNMAAGGTEGSFTDEQLVRNLSDIFVAGYETTSTFLRWSMVYMILNPSVQKKIQAEIDAVIGQSRLPAFADKAKMPYTDAVTLEIHRISYFVPFGVPHRATEEVEFDGYTIPEGTEIWPIMCYHFINPDVFKDPLVFRPERFLDSEGNLIPAMVDEVQPFSVGRRACLGEPLARMEVFCFFAAIIQNFTLSSPTPPTTDSAISAVRAPLDFTMVATSRV